MEVKKFKQLQKKIDNLSYEEAYKPINITLKALSFLGNIGSIFLASFFMSKLIKDSIQYIESDTVVWIITLTLLFSLEMIKRFVFDRFSTEFVKLKTIFNSKVVPLAFFSLCIIGMSFYSSLSGAKEFSSKSDAIDVVQDNEMSVYTDSINGIYLPKIASYEQEIIDNKESIKRKDEEQATINTRLQERGYLYGSERQRNKQLTDEKKELKSENENIEVKITDLKNEKDALLKSETDRLTSISSEQKDENQSNSLIFVMISTIIEFLILIGIFFHQHYTLRIYRDMKRKVNLDPNYVKWILYTDILDICFRVTEGDERKLPSNKELYNLCELQDIYLTEGDIENAFKIYKALKISITKGSTKFLIMDEKESLEELKKYFKI